MDEQNGELDRKLAEVFREIARNRGEPYAQQLRMIVEENRKRGRLQWYLDQNPSHGVPDYVHKVMRHYDEQHKQMIALQVDKDPVTWRALHEQTQQYAYHLFRRWGFVNGQSALTAHDVAQDACIEVLFAYFPYDTQLKAWVYKIAYYVGYKYAQKMRSDEQEQTDIDKTDYKSHEESAPTRDLELQLRVTKEELTSALQQLTSLQQDVILAHYMLGKSLAQIAAETGTSPNAIYKRHHDALKKLGKILGIAEH